MSKPLARASRSAAGTGTAPTRQQLDELDALLQRMLDLPVNQGSEAEAPAPEPLPLPRRPEPDEPLVFPPVYTRVEHSAPSYRAPADQPSAGLGPRLVQREAAPEPAPFEEPVPGGRHDLEEDTPVDPTEELARLRARLEAAALSPASPTDEPEQDGWVPLRSSWQPSAQTWKPLAERWGQAQVSPEPGPAPVPRIAPPVFPPQRSGPAGPTVTTHTQPDPVPPPPQAAPEPPPPAEPVSESAPRPWPLLPLLWFNTAFDLALVPLGPLGRWLRGSSGRAFLATIGFLCLVAAAILLLAYRAGWGW